MLWASAEEREFDCPFWLTFKQAAELGGHVKKGEDGEDKEEKIPFLKEYTVFNALEVEGLPERFFQLSQALETSPPACIEQSERFFANTKADIRIGGNRAYYAGDADYIRMPPFEDFRDA